MTESEAAKQEKNGVTESRRRKDLEGFCKRIKHENVSGRRARPVPREGCELFREGVTWFGEAEEFARPSKREPCKAILWAALLDSVSGCRKYCLPGFITYLLAEVNQQQDSARAGVGHDLDLDRLPIDAGLEMS